MNSPKTNPALVIGIVLPFVFIAVLVAAVMIPSMSIRPAHNFLYVNDIYPGYSVEPVGYKNKYVVTDGHVELQSLGNPGIIGSSSRVAPTLYLYDMASGSSKAIDVVDAEKLSVGAGVVSSDGYTVEYKYNNDGIFGLFGGGSGGEGYFVTKGGASRRLTGMGTTYPYSFQFIGWVN